MQRTIMWAAAALTPFLWLGGASGKDPAKPAAAVKPADDDGGGCHGTAIQFLDSPSVAAKQALKEQKLVFVLHVSGHFEDPGIT